MTDPDPQWVSLSGTGDPHPGRITVPTSGVDAILGWAVGIGSDVPLPGFGRTRQRWETLATVGALDLTAARVLEPHLDALAILAEAGVAPEPTSSWGVYAAEGAGGRLHAVEEAGGWVLSGTKPWCSLAGHLSHALVTAWVTDAERAMFAVELDGPGVTVEDGPWAPSGLVEVVTSTVSMRAVPARPVGGPGWYLGRDGFAWGGLGVAAVWYGGAVGLARRLLAETGRREPDQVALMHLGAADAELAAARALLAEAAAAVDSGQAVGPTGPLLAARVRQVVADLAESVSSRVAHALGPGPLAQEPDHARRVSDLALYVRQHHAERDAVALGRLLVTDGGTGPAGRPW